MKRIVSLLALLALSVPALAQVDTVWVREYGGSGSSDEANGCVASLDGGVFVTGRADTTMVNFDYLTIKYDDNGNIKWLKYFEGPSSNYDEATACAVDKNNDLYVTGWSMCPPSNHYGRLTIKYSGITGDTIWTRLFDTAPGNDGHGIVTDDSCNVITTGKTTINTHNNFLTIKYDSTGQEKWVKIFTSNYNIDEQGLGCAVDAFGNIYVTGYSANTTDNDIFTIKYDFKGDTIWTRRYSRGSASGSACAVDDSGNLYVVGNEYNNFIAIKYKQNGDTVWSKIYTVSDDSNSGARSCAIDKKGYLYVTGYHHFSEMITLKIDCATGDSITTFGSPCLSGYTMGNGCCINGSNRA